VDEHLMSEAISGLFWLRDPLLAPLALGPWPAWAWSLDGTRILFANPTGAAIFGAETPATLAACRFQGSDVAAQVVRLAATLPEGTASRFERLRGFGTGPDRTLTCRCSRAPLSDGTDAILIAATEQAGPELALAERVAYLLAGTEAPVAAFAPDGKLIEATAAAQGHLAGATTLAALGAEALPAGADSHAEGDTAAGRLTLDRVGTVLFATFGAAPAPAGRRQPLRFVWQIDADGRFTLDSEEFATLTGAHVVLGRTWTELSETLQLDPDGEIMRALTTRDTFSGITIGWPVDGDGAPLPVELSGLPVFDRERRFRGYRGFGICRDLARLDELAQRAATHPPAAPMQTMQPAAPEPVPATEHPDASPDCRDAASAKAEEPESAPSATARAIGPVLDRLPVGILIYRLNELVYANRLFLRWTGYASVSELARAGGIESLLIGSGSVEPGEAPFTITSSQGESVPVAGRLFSVPWEGDKAFALITTPAASAPAEPPAASTALADAQAEIAELRAIADMVDDAIVVLDGELRITSANRRAAALFGPDTLVRAPFASLFAPASRDSALAQIAKLNEGGGGGAIEVNGGGREGTEIALSMTVGRLGTDRLGVVLRDLSPSRKHETELIAARLKAEKQSAAKSEFLAKVSHEVRNPLNAIIGFSELMMEERFGAIGNDRYRQYLKDIHSSGGHIMSLVSDLLDLSKIEAGHLELAFAGVALNELIEQCVALMQPQANREGIILRTSFSPRLPDVMADARSLRQIVLNLVASSIKLTGAGGQVIVSTARAEGGALILRVRDTGAGMSDKELADALEPLQQVSSRSGGSGLGLPLAKALAEANGASLRIESNRGSGTLIEVTFPRERVLG
jgi:signal transduction histidine kinase